MLQQQLRQKDEDIAAKAAEIGELKERVAALEKLKQQQDQLLSMKDTELAAVQQNLADARKSAAAGTAPTANAPVPATQQQAAQAAQPAEQAQAPNPMPWLWGGLALVGLALLAWLFMRRGPRSRAKAPPRRGFDSESLAASMAPPTQGETPRDEPVRIEGGAPASTTTVVDLAEVPAMPPRMETPNWHSGWVKTADSPSPPPTEAPKPRFVPQEPDLPPPPQATAEQRMKLARAFLDIGDEHSAKELLRELLDGPDPALRNEAARMLRELG